MKFESSDYLSENQNFSFSGVNEQNVTQVFFEFLNNGNSSSINITSIDLDMIV
ncbi:MAG: hypothetical protein P1U46_01815 [Patescibacteria group bacterium]|nr:hypothetical protein [Patescibacteria group bacterium]